MPRVVALSVFLALSLAVIFSIVAPRPVAAQDILAPNPDIEAVIGNQFEAFRTQDMGEAWQYASPNIQSMFSGPDNFGVMVEQAFPMVYTPGAVDFIDLQALGGLLIQRVEVVDALGNLHYLGYAMVETPEGWRINGVQILRAPSLGA